MKGSSTFRAVLTSLFGALTCVATMFIRIPSPTGGYLNLGDGIVLMSAYLLGPLWGTLAAGLGSMLADVLAGYAAYAPGTLIIKGLVAVIAGSIYRALHHRRGEKPVAHILLSGLLGELWMALGYFLYTMIFLSYGPGAAIEIPGNLAQGAAGIAVAMALTPVLLNSREVREMLEKLNRHG